MATFTTTDGLTLYYEDAGDGLPLLCLPGLTRTCRDFDYVAPHLSGVRLIRLDYRGRGRSDWAPDPSSYSLAVEGRDVLELLDHLGLSQSAILGTSRGGLIAMGLAAYVPERLLGVALNDIGPEIDPEGMGFIMTYLGRNPEAKTHEDAAKALSQTMTGFENVPAERWLAEVRTHYRASPQGLEITYDPKLRDAVAATQSEDLPDLWPIFDALPARPLALIWGENSDLLKALTVAEMQRRRPDLVLGKVPGRGHIPFLDEPESLTALTTWLGQLR